MSFERSAHRSPPPLAPGTRLGPWLIVQHHSQGSFGTVYRAVRAGHEHAFAALKLAVYLYNGNTVVGDSSPTAPLRQALRPNVLGHEPLPNLPINGGCWVDPPAPAYLPPRSAPMKPSALRLLVSVFCLLPVLLLANCETPNSASAPLPPVPPPASHKWVSPGLTTPDGRRIQRTFYYGPWQCSQKLMDACQRKCADQKHLLMGCIWLTDIKVDTQGSAGPIDYAAGGRFAITHCCCDYPIVMDGEARRDAWEKGTKAFRRKWSSEFGAWPLDSRGNHWPGHHLRDLLHGGDPLADGNVIPIPNEVHFVVNKAYRQCYKGSSFWSTSGLDLPYSD